MDNKISVIMGIYNCANTLSEAIDSILNQTYDNWELILCDDGSVDNTYSVAESYKEKYPEKIVLIRNNKNMGLAFSLNHCLKYATGKFVARMDGDDISVPERFQKQINFLLNHEEYSLVGTAMQQFNEEFGDIQVVRCLEYPDKNTLINSCPFCHATIMTYKSVYDALNGYTVSKNTLRCEDFDLWIRFFHAGFSGANLQEPLYRVREDINTIKRRTFKSRWAAHKVYKSAIKLFSFPKFYIVKNFIVIFFISFIPFRFLYLYRKFQKHKGKNIN